jgi:hypothetical protein
MGRPIVDGAERVRGRLMAQSLGALLDKVRGSREVLPHLAAMERALVQQGPAAIHRVPEHWLRKIGSQLASLPLPEGDEPLRDLLGRLVAAQEAMHSDAHQRPFDIERTVIIEEATHSDFMAVAQEQSKPQPQTAPQLR